MVVPVIAPRSICPIHSILYILCMSLLSCKPWFVISDDMIWGLDCIYFINTLRQRQNGRHFADDMFKWIFLNENVWIPIEIPLKFVPKCSINSNTALFQIMAWRRPGDKPLSEPMLVRSLTHICVTRPQWVNVIDDLLLHGIQSHCGLHWNGGKVIVLTKVWYGLHWVPCTIINIILHIHLLIVMTDD